MHFILAVQPISWTVHLELQSTMEDFTAHLRKLGNKSDESLLRVHELQGTRSTFRDFMAPGVLIT